MAIYKEVVKVINPLGIHARPSSLIVKKAAELKTKDVFLAHPEKSITNINPQSIMHVLMMGAGMGDIIEVYTERDDMHKAVTDLAEMIRSNFEECY